MLEDWSVFQAPLSHFFLFTSRRASPVRNVVMLHYLLCIFFIIVMFWSLWRTWASLTKSCWMFIHVQMVSSLSSYNKAHCLFSLCMSWLCCFTVLCSVPHEGDRLGEDFYHWHGWAALSICSWKVCLFLVSSSFAHYCLSVVFFPLSGSSVM